MPTPIICRSAGLWSAPRFWVISRFIGRDEGDMRICRLFRSLHVPRLSLATERVNVPGRLNRHCPGDPGSRQENRRFAIPSSFSSGFSGTGAGNVPVNAPSPRIHARHPCLRKRLSDLQPDQGPRFSPEILMGKFCADKQNIRYDECWFRYADGLSV